MNGNSPGEDLNLHLKPPVDDTFRVAFRVDQGMEGERLMVVEGVLNVRKDLTVLVEEVMAKIECVVPSGFLEAETRARLAEQFRKDLLCLSDA